MSLFSALSSDRKDQIEDTSKESTTVLNETSSAGKDQSRDTLRDEILFLAVGDWGESSLIQRMVALQMAEEERDFVVALGDNFYEYGVESSTDEKSLRLWNGVFVEPFAEIDCPWYPILGNHDWEGNVTAQVEFSQLDPRWKMETPVRSHVFGPNQLLEIFFLDTTTLSPEMSEIYTMKKFSQDAKLEQLFWLEEQLTKSTARWKIVCGHYPIHSTGPNGSTEELKVSLDPLLAQHSVDAYFCGHDHSLQHLFNPATNIQYFVSGSGCRSSSFPHIHRSPYTVFQSKKCGYASCRIEAEVATVRFVDFEGNELYRFSFQKQGKSSSA